MGRYLNFFAVDTFDNNFDLIFDNNFDVIYLDKIAEHCQTKFLGFKGQITNYRE